MNMNYVSEALNNSQLSQNSFRSRPGHAIYPASFAGSSSACSNRSQSDLPSIFECLSNSFDENAFEENKDMCGKKASEIRQ